MNDIFSGIYLFGTFSIFLYFFAFFFVVAVNNFNCCCCFVFVLCGSFTPKKLNFSFSYSAIENTVPIETLLEVSVIPVAFRTTDVC